MDDMKSLEIICKKCASPTDFLRATILRDYIYRCSNCGSLYIAFKDGSKTVRIQPLDLEEDLNRKMTLHFKERKILIADEIVNATIVIGNGLIETPGDGLRKST